MQVMHEKGLLLRIEDQRSHIYEPAVSKDEAQARFAGELMHRVFWRARRAAWCWALNDGAARLRAEELEEIREILDRFEKKRKK